MEVSPGASGRRKLGPLLVPFLPVFVLVLKAAADCPIPEAPAENVVLAVGIPDGAPLKPFHEGTTVSFECTTGYVKESGSGIVRCIDGKWNQTDLTCKKKSCGPPEPQPHMNFDVSEGYLFGALIKVTCDKGYEIIGSSYRRCYSGGWLYKRARCEVIRCDKPDEVANGKSSWDSQDNPKYGEEIQYVCNEGYTIIGNENITCSETGQYDSPPPVCKDMTTEDSVTTPAPIQATSTSTDSSATSSAAHRKRVVTPRAAPAVTPSSQDSSATSTASHRKEVVSPRATLAVTPSLQDSVPVIVSVACVSLGACIAIFFLNRFLTKRKGSPTGTVLV